MRSHFNTMKSIKFTSTNRRSKKILINSHHDNDNHHKHHNLNHSLHSRIAQANIASSRKRLISYLCPITLAFTIMTTAIISPIPITSNAAHASSNSGRMVRLCIASVDPIKLSSQCVMCNRRDFPLTVIDCTGITKVNDLIANPLSVREATCLIYNCRRQVPEVKPEPYHGSVSHAANYRNGSPNQMPAYSSGIAASGSQLYEMVPPSGLMTGSYSMIPGQNFVNHPSAHSTSPYMSRFGSGYRQSMRGSSANFAPLSSLPPRGLMGASGLIPDRQQALPYALIPAPKTFPFGLRKYRAALVPLFR